MKRIFSLTLAILLFLAGFSAFGDVVFAPPSDFYETHRKECATVERNYYANGKEGYINLHEEPKGAVCGYLTNATKVHIFCTYEEWGMISYVDGTPQQKEKWVSMKDLYLIYDEQSFREEHADQITNGEPLTLSEDLPYFYVYTYPGAENPSSISYISPEMQATARYTDPEGRIWGRIAYFQGIRNEWICFSDPTALIEPFGGDPDLSQIEGAEEKTDEPFSEESPLVEPEEVPEKLPVNPLLYLAVALVAVAVIAAVLLLLFCYKKER